MKGALAETGGDIRVALDVANGRVAAVQVVSSRPVHAARMFIGRTAEETIATIGRVFTLCGRAQTIASLRAVEDASGVSVAAAVESGRDTLRLAEMISQTAMRLCLFWPQALGLPPQPELVRLSLETERAIETLLLGGEAWKRPGSGVLARCDALGRQIDRLAEASDAFVHTCPLRQEVRRRGLDGFGALPDGAAPEEGPLKRHWDDPAIAQLRAQHGAGLLARLEAGLVDLFLLQGRLLAAYATIEAIAAQDVEAGTGKGETVVETARGPLCHRLELAGGVVTDYRAEAPTELNFRAGGPVEAGLIGVPADGIEQAARLHVLAIDPCVEFAVEVRDA